MKYLLDTDHISILQQQSGPEYVALASHIARSSPVDLALSVVSFHEQVLACHTGFGRWANAAARRARPLRGASGGQQLRGSGLVSP